MKFKSNLTAITASLMVLLAGFALTGCSSAPREVVNTSNQTSLKFGDVVDSKTLIVNEDPAPSKESISVTGDISAHNDPAFSNKRNVFHVLNAMRAVRLSRQEHPNIVSDDSAIYQKYFAVWDGQIYKIGTDKTVLPVNKMFDARGEQPAMSGGYQTSTSIQLGTDMGSQRQVKIVEEFASNPDKLATVTYSHSSSLLADWVENQHAWMFYFSNGNLFRVYANGKFDTLNGKPVVHQHPDRFIFLPANHSSVDVRDLSDDGRDVLIRTSSYSTFETKYELYRWNENTTDVVAHYSETYGTWYASIGGTAYFVQFDGDSFRLPGNGIILRAPGRLRRPQLYIAPNSANADAPPAVVPGRPNSERPASVSPRRPSDDRPAAVMPSRPLEEKPVVIVSPNRYSNDRFNSNRPAIVTPSHTNQGSLVLTPSRHNDDRPTITAPSHHNQETPVLVTPSQLHDDRPIVVSPSRF